MTAYVHKRCFVHGAREAACLCTECRNPFCRECVSEHHGRFVCTRCLAQMRSHDTAGWRRLERVRGAASVSLALVIAWMFFYMAGRLLLLAEPARHTFSDTTAQGKK
jgi:hypothetical protein